MKRIMMTVMLLMAMPVAAQAADGAPDANTVKQVLSYYQNGKLITLVDYKFCTEIEKEGDNRNECAEVVDGNQIEKGSKVYLWLNFFVPGDDTEKANVLLQFKHKGTALDSKEVSVSQAIRYRTWRTIPTGKSGGWTIPVKQEGEAGYVDIDDISYTVVEPMAEPGTAAAMAGTAQ